MTATEKRSIAGEPTSVRSAAPCLVHLTSSTLYGGPERQMLGLAEALAGAARTRFLSFREGGRCGSFLAEARRRGFEATALPHDTPHLIAAVRDIADILRRESADVLFCHGYKADLLGRKAARRVGIPVVAVARGWTAENAKVRLYEALDRFHLRFLDRVVCVSEAQAAKVRRAGVAPERVAVIRNAVRADRFARPNPEYRERLYSLFGRVPSRLVGAAGRLSPEKGFRVFVEAARRVSAASPDVGFVLFGDGPLREELRRRVAAAGLGQSFALEGFRADFDSYLPWLDLLVLPSFTEGLPNVVLEAFAAGVPVVATAVGGTPEAIDDGVSGYLVPPGDADALAARIQDVVREPDAGRGMGELGRRRVRDEFTFAAQADRYRRLLADLGIAILGGPHERR